jgi:hypothetical protein
MVVFDVEAMTWVPVVEAKLTVPTEKPMTWSLVMPSAESLVDSVAATTGVVAVSAEPVTELDASVPAPRRSIADTAAPPLVIAAQFTFDLAE